ncbi:MAG: DNA primase [Phycisphaerae bacterium]
MHDPVAIREKIRNSVDLVDLVSEHTALRRQGRNYIGLCPFHQEKTPSFSVNAERQFFKCFGCDRGGDIFTFVQLRESVEFVEALRILADRAGVDLARAGTGRSDHTSRSDLARANAWALEYFRSLFESEAGGYARKYVESRGLSRESIESFGMGWACGDGGALIRAAKRAGIDHRVLSDAGLCRQSANGDSYDTFRDRLVFPIRDTMKRCLGFGGRTLVEDRAKYLNTPETALFNKSRCLFGIDLARPAIEAAGVAIVVEGYTDCIAAHQHGFSNTVATLGTAATEASMAQLRRYCSEVILVFDSDAAGAAAADRALAVALRQNLSVKLAHVDHGKDPCEFLQHIGAKGFRNMLNSAVDALGYRWTQTRSRFDAGHSPTARRQAVLEFVTLAAELCEFGVLDAIQRGVIVSQLSDLLSVPAAEVGRLIAQRHVRRRSGPEQGAPRGRQARLIGDPEQAALVTMLEVLVNEPGLMESAGDQFDPAGFADAGYRRIAEQVRELALAEGAFRFETLQSRIEDTQEAELLTDLAIRGSQVGNYLVTLEGACRRLSQIAAARDTRRLTDEVKQRESDGQPLDDEMRDQWRTIRERLAGHRHFSRPRDIAEHCDSQTAGPSVSEN